MIDLNISALTQFCKLFIPEIKQNGGGKIMNVASTAGFQPGPYMAVYFATKNYVLAFSEAIDSELMGGNITVTALCPGATESGFQKAAAADNAKLFKGNIPSSKDVAEYGYKALMNGKRVAIHGFINKILTFSSRFVPRNMVTWMTKKIVK